MNFADYWIRNRVVTLVLAFVMIVGFVACDLLYKKAAKVPGF